MEYIKKDLGTYKLHIVKTDKFKTIRIKIAFRSPIKKEEITLRNILANVLVQSSKKYQTKRDLIIQSQNLYAANISSNISRIGNYINTDIVLSVLNDKYTEKGNFNNSLDFLKEIIYNPNVDNNKFDEKSLDIVLKSAATSLDSIKEDSNFYSILRTLEELDSKAPFGYRTIGYKEDLEKITPEDLYKYYTKMIEKDLMDIFVVGDINPSEVEEQIKEIFKIKTFKKQKMPYLLEDVKPRKKVNYIVEEGDNEQSNLVIACKMSGLTKFERNYGITLYNIILGSGTDSKLFQNVREKNSLCYTISSVPNKLDNNLIIRSGIDGKNIKKVIKLVEKEINEMKKGKFTDKDIDIAREYYLTALDSIFESEAGITEYYYMADLLELDLVEERRKKIKEVTKQDLIKIAKKIKMDTVFCLKGVKE